MSDRRDFIKKLLVGGSAALVESEFHASRAVAQLYPSLRATPGSGWALLPEILKRIKPPVFPRRDFNVTHFGAVSDGKTDCSDAFRKAIAACGRSGGGRVLVPPGIFLSGPIHLRSNVNLHLSSAATIKFSQDSARYLPVVFSRWEGMELMNYSPFIYAFEQRNIAITGKGTLDGQSNAEAWWPWTGSPRYGGKEGAPNARKARTALLEMIERGVPVRERVFGEGHYLRPQFIQPYRCQNVLIEGVTIRNSPMWEIHPVLCRNVTVQSVTIDSHGPNNDGCDPESCTDVLIRDCDFNTGDDCIAIKSGRNADGRRLNTPAQNIVIQSCRMRDGHGGITIGSEISGGVRNVFAEGCQMSSPTLETALRVKNNAMRGGLLEDLYFRNIEVGQVSRAAITIDFNYEEGERGKFIPVVRNFVVNDLKSGKSKHALDVQGLKHAQIGNLRLENCTFDNVAEPSIVKNVGDIILRNVRINGQLVQRLDGSN